MKRVLVYCCLVAAAGCGKPAPQLPSITLGAVIDRTSTDATPSWEEAVKLAVADANAGLKAKARPWQFAVALSDSTNKPDVASRRAQEVVRESGAKMVITDSSQDDIAINNLAYDDDPTNDLQVPTLCVACTSTSINNPKSNKPDGGADPALRNEQGWNFRTSMPTTLIAKVIARMAYETAPNGDANGDGKFKVALYVMDDSSGKGFAKDLGPQLTRLRADAIFDVVYYPAASDPSTYDWASDLARVTDDVNETTKLVDGVPDVVVDFHFPQPAAAVMKAYLDGAYPQRILHTQNGRTGVVTRALGSRYDGQEGASHVLLDNGASGEVFAAELLAATGKGPAFRDSTVYDGATLMMLATVRAMQVAGVSDPDELSGAQIRDSMKSINDLAGEVIRTGPAEFSRAVELLGNGAAINYEGASGPCDFDANGNVRDRLAHWKVVNKDFVDIERFDCVSNDDCAKEP
jgi:ABC-type branched-subunit amino acid transport system substrate-binding protein